MHSRNLFLDNAKGILILLVVFGHALEPVLGVFESAQALYMFIYAFHMPVFVALAGYLAKTQLRPKDYSNILKSLVFTYVIAQVAYRLSEAWWIGQPVNFNITTPYWLLWFLASLVVWRLILPLWMTLRWPLLSAFGLALAAGYVNEIGYFLSLSRTLYFFPFFVLGAILGNRGAIPSASTLVKCCAACVLVIGAYGAVLAAASDLPARLFYGSFSYHALGYAGYTGAMVRLATYGVAGVIGLAFMALIPHRDTIFATMGQNSLPIYILHGFALKTVIALGYYHHIPPEYAILILAVISFAACLTFKSKPMNWAFTHCIEAFGATRILLSAPQSRTS